MPNYPSKNPSAISGASIMYAKTIDGVVQLSQLREDGLDYQVYPGDDWLESDCYWVDPAGGDDANDGRFDRPLETVEAAVAKLPGAGTSRQGTIYLYPGEHVLSAGLTFTAGGVAIIGASEFSFNGASTILRRSDNNGPVLTFNGPGSASIQGVEVRNIEVRVANGNTTDAVIFTEGGSYTRFEDLLLRGGLNAFHVEGGPNMIIRNCGSVQQGDDIYDGDGAFIYLVNTGSELIDIYDCHVDECPRILDWITSSSGTVNFFGGKFERGANLSQQLNHGANFARLRGFTSGQFNRLNVFGFMFIHSDVDVSQGGGAGAPGSVLQEIIFDTSNQSTAITLIGFNLRSGTAGTTAIYRNTTTGKVDLWNRQQFYNICGEAILVAGTLNGAEFDNLMIQDHMLLPTQTTAGRGAADVRKFIYNSTKGSLEFADGSNWLEVVHNDNFGAYAEVHKDGYAIAGTITTTTVMLTTYDSTGPSNNMTVITGSDQIQVSYDAVYEISFNAVIDGTANSNFTFYVAVNGSPTGYWTRQILTASAQDENVSLNAILSLSTNDIVSIWVESTSVSGVTLVTRFVSLSVKQISIKL